MDKRYQDLLKMTITVNADWLNTHINDPSVIIIDSRGVIPYKLGHIKNAMLLGIEHVICAAENGSSLVINQEEVEKLFSELGINHSKTVIIYGEYPDPSSARIVWTLMYYGHTNVKLLDIGFEQWRKKGLPVSIGISNEINNSLLPDGSSFIVKVDALARADAQMIKEKQNSPNVIIVDARTPQEHFQARIPGSVLVNWEEGLGDYGEMIKDKDALYKEFEEKGITKDKEVICYCHSGIRASHMYLQLKHAGFEKVRLYDGSIIDWARRRNPIR